MIFKELWNDTKEFGLTFVLPIVAVGGLGWGAIGIFYLVTGHMPS